MARHAKAENETPEKQGKNHLTVYQKKSRRMRRVLIVVIILIIVLIAALGYFSVRLYQEAQNEATQQTISQSHTDVDELKENDAQDATTSTTKDIDTPELLEVLGMTQAEALTAIGHGATVVSEIAVNEEGNPVKTSVRVTLTDDPSDPNTGSTPTVYLDLDEAGKVILVGYSASASSLGYDISSFQKAVTEDHIIENTLTDAGLVVAVGSAELPEDKSSYSVYASDGTTLESASYSFSGYVGMDETTEYDWSAVVRFDYSKANSSGNLNDTIAQVYIYISDTGLAVEAAETPADATSGEGTAETQPDDGTAGTPEADQTAA